MFWRCIEDRLGSHVTRIDAAELATLPLERLGTLTRAEICIDTVRPERLLAMDRSSLHRCSHISGIDFYPSSLLWVSSWKGMLLPTFAPTHGSSFFPFALISSIHGLQSPMFCHSAELDGYEVLSLKYVPATIALLQPRLPFFLIIRSDTSDLKSLGLRSPSSTSLALSLPLSLRIQVSTAIIEPQVRSHRSGLNMIVKREDPGLMVPQTISRRVRRTASQEDLELPHKSIHDAQLA